MMRMVLEFVENIVVVAAVVHDDDDVADLE
jgi:hypothetical protein